MLLARVSVLFFFKQKTAYEIPKRDWSSDVCSSDLLRPVMACGEAEEARPVFHSTALGIAGGKIEPAQSRERDRRRAHGAGLERHLEIGVGQALQSQGFSAGADGQHLGMGCGIAQLLHPI